MVIRRVLEAATRTLPLMLILFIPILFGARHIYPWTDRGKFAGNAPMLDKIDHYLNLRFFILRAVIYFAIWLVLAYFLNKWSREQDSSGTRRSQRRCAS